MEHVRRLSEIRELQRRNIREGIGDAEGTDERVVAMYAELIDTAGLTYQGVVQHDKVAKKLSKSQLDRIPAKRNPSATTCSLCLEPMPVGLRVATLPCCGTYISTAKTGCQHPSLLLSYCGNADICCLLPPPATQAIQTCSTFRPYDPTNGGQRIQTPKRAVGLKIV